MRNRRCFFLGPRSYKYGNVYHAENMDWPPFLATLRDYLSGMCGTLFNSLLINYYRSGKDFVGWHSDAETTLCKYSEIASVSLGAERRFDLRRVGHSDIFSVTLPHGSLLRMMGAFQEEFQHHLPPDPNCDRERINLTFRVVKS